MPFFSRFSRLQRNLFHKDSIDRDLDLELRAYVDHLTDEKIRSGMPPAQARRAALLETGGIEVVKEQVRDTRTFEWLHGLWLDARYAARSLRKSVGFSTVAVLSMALGIGANATIFAVFYTVLLRPLPYRDPGRLVAAGRVMNGADEGGVMSPELTAWRAGNRVFDGLAAWDDDHYNLTGAGTPERIAAAVVTSNFLDVLGVASSVGRSFVAQDGDPGAPQTVLLTAEFWQRYFHADPSVVGRVLLLNDNPTTVIGVLPGTFRFPGNAHPEILSAAPLPHVPDWGARRVEGFYAIGRLRHGATADSAAADLTAVSSSGAGKKFVDMWGGAKTHVRVVSLQQQLAGDTRPALRMLLGAVGLLFLIACVNVANLQLGRIAIRGREMALRSALGASRGRLARLMLMENLVLAIFTGFAGVFVASVLGGVLSLSSGLPLHDPRDVQMSWLSGGAAFALSLAAGGAIGMILAILAPRTNLNDVLKSQAAAALGGRGGWIRSAMVLSQVALALILLIGSGLLLRSLQAVLAVDPGFRPGSVLTAGLRLPNSRYKSDEQQHAFVRALLERVEALPGVDSAAISSGLPLAGYSMVGALRTEGQPAPKRATDANSPMLSVTPQYFHSMGMRLEYGRGFGPEDTATSIPAAIVNQRFAKKFFHTENVLGKRFQIFNFADDAPWYTIIGVLTNVRQDGAEHAAAPEVYFPEAQSAANNLKVAIHTKSNALALASGIRAAVWSIDKDLPVNDVMSMDQRIAKSGASRTLQTWLLTAFAALALLLAAIGIYGVVAEVVNQRTREIGLRMALGAQAASVLRMVMRGSLTLAAVGIVIGLAAGRYLSKYLASLLFGVKPTDLWTLGGAAVVLLAVVVLAGFVPARRASRIDPVAALRCE